jgi:hypothetical protein
VPVDVFGTVLRAAGGPAAQHLDPDLGPTAAAGTAHVRPPP